MYYFSKKINLIGILVCLIAGCLLVVLAWIFYIVNFLPNTGGAPDLKVKSTPQRLQRGEYLARNVANCIDCHSSRDESKFAAPLLEGTLGQGGAVYKTEFGKVIAPNITPDAIGNWTDGELFRAITTGVSKDGSPLFPIMPYLDYGRMDKEDVYDIIAYIRSLKPIHHIVEKTSLKFPANIIVHTLPRRPRFAQKPPEDDTIRYGGYLVLAAGCQHCHTPKDKGQNIAGREFSGGFPLPLPSGGVVLTANITPDTATGIGSWSKALFLQRFKASLDSGYSHPIRPGDVQTEMPWTFYAKMRSGDLEAIYDYLRTVRPVSNKVKH